MNRVASVLVSLLLVAVIALPALSQEKKAKRKGEKADPAAAVLKRLEKADLKEEQVAKIKELVAKMNPAIEAARAKANLTPEQMQARKEATEKAKADGKKGKEMAAAVKAAVALTAEQEKALADARAANMALMKEIAGLLTPAQREAAELKMGEKPARKPGGKKRAA